MLAQGLVGWLLVELQEWVGGSFCRIAQLSSSIDEWSLAWRLVARWLQRAVKRQWWVC